MNFLERLLGFSPDGGNGSFEMAFLLSGISTLAALFTLKVIHRRGTARS
jgi:hypothetical protein